MAVKFDSFKDMFDHMQQVCNAFNHVLEIKPIIKEDGKETHVKPMGELKKEETKQ